VAIDYALGWGIPAIGERVSGLADRLRAALGELPGVTVRDLGAERCGIVTFTMAGLDAADIKRAMAAQSINVTTSSAASTRLDMDARGLDRVVRASVHYYNTDEEVERFCRALRALARRGPGGPGQ
jgi:selenocysteine lyase/cysteine desulfurase